LLLSHRGCIQRTKKKDIPKIRIISLCVVLLTGVFVIPTLQIGVQATTISDINPLINNVAQRIVSGNGGDINPIIQVLQQIATQISEIAGQTNATKTITRIASDVDLNSESPVSVSLVQLVIVKAVDINTLNKVIQDIAQQISQGATVPDIIAEVVIPAVTDMQNANQLISQIAQNVISGNTDNLGQVIESSLIVCPPKQQYFKQISEGFCSRYFNWYKENELQNYFVMPVSTDRIFGQQQQSQQQNSVGLSQVIKQIAQQVANANPGTNATHVQQILVQLAKQTAQTASKEQAIQEIQQISSQITKFPYGTVSQSLAHFAGQLVSASSSGRADTGTNNVIQIAQQIAQEKASGGGNVSQSVVNKAVQTATGANSNNINEHIRQTAQIIAKQTGVPVEKVEAIIIQMALQIAQAQGKDITGQSIFQIANQITNNPNGIYTQLLLQLVKQDKDDNGKSDHTVKIIRSVIRSGDNVDSGSSSSSNPPSPTTITLGQVEKVIQQIILKISIQGGESSAQRALTEIADQVADNPKGPISRSIFHFSQNQASGDLSAVNQAINKVAEQVSRGDNIAQILGSLTTTTTIPPLEVQPLIPLPALPLGDTPITTGPVIHLCFICAVGNAVINQRVNNIALEMAQNTGLSKEANQLAVSNTILRIANKAELDQASLALVGFEKAAADPNSLKKLGDLAKLYENGNDAAANQASDSLADKLSTGSDTRIALAETPIPDAEPLAGATGGEGAPLLDEEAAEAASLDEAAGATGGEGAPLLDEEAAGGAAVDGTTTGDGEITGELASEEDDDSDSEEEAGTADEEEAAASDDSENDGDAEDGGGDTEVSADDEGDDSDDGGDDGGGGDGDDGGGGDGDDGGGGDGDDGGGGDGDDGGDGSEG
jgi:hypothetical protein